MLNERLERIYKDGIKNYIAPMNTLNLEENPTIVFDIESCGLENNTRALTYSIAAMSATNDSDIMYWGNSVKEFMDLLLNSSFTSYTVGYTFGPIGNPIIYHPIKSSNQVIEIIIQYGIIILIDSKIPIGFDLSVL